MRPHSPRRFADPRGVHQPWPRTGSDDMCVTRFFGEPQRLYIRTVAFISFLFFNFRISLGMLRGTEKIAGGLLEETSRVILKNVFLLTY